MSGPVANGNSFSPVSGALNEKKLHSEFLGFATRSQSISGDVVAEDGAGPCHLK